MRRTRLCVSLSRVTSYLGCYKSVNLRTFHRNRFAQAGLLRDIGKDNFRRLRWLLAKKLKQNNEHRRINTHAV